MEILKKASTTFLFIWLFINGCTHTNDGLKVANNNQPSTGDIAIESVAKLGIEAFWSINSADPNYLYVGTGSAIMEVDKNTGGTRAVIGNTYDRLSPIAVASVAYPIGIQLYAGTVYAGTASGRVVSGFTGTDGFESVNIFLPSVPGDVNGLDLVTSNSTTLYYGGYYGIYAKTYDSQDAPTLLYPTSSPEGYFNAIATDQALYIITYTSGGPKYYLKKFDLSTKLITTLQSNLTPRPGGTGVTVFPMTRLGSSIYWVDGGCSIYKLDTNSDAISLVATDNSCGIGHIEADNNYIYYAGPQPYEFSTVSLVSGATATLASNGYIWSFAVDAGNIYFATDNPFKIKKIDQTQQVVTLFDLPDLGLSSIYDVKVVTSNGKLIITTGQKAFIYDIASQSTETIATDTGSVMWARNGEIYTGEYALDTIPLAKPIRPITEIYPANTDPNSNYYGVVSTAIDADSIYWITSGVLNQTNHYYRISKAAHDGSNYQVLHEGSGELRDLSLNSGKLFFTCFNDCGDQGWVLASLPVIGGTPTVEFGLLKDPLTYYKNGIFYVVDTSDYATRSLFSINIEAQDFKELVSNLYFDGQTQRNVIVDVSSKWLYIAEYQMQMGGPPLAGLSRFPLNGWNSLGAEQIVFNQNTADVNNFIIGTISTDNKHLYFWNNGLKRIAE